MKPDTLKFAALLLFVVNAVLSAAPVQIISTPEMVDGHDNNLYGASIETTATGGSGTYTWSLEGLPAGFSTLPWLSTLVVTGTISESLSASTTYPITLKVVDANNPGDSDSIVFDWVIHAEVKLSWSEFHYGVVGKPYEAVTLTATGGLAPHTLLSNKSILPPGLTFEQISDSSWIVTGTPKANGAGKTYNPVVRIRDSVPIVSSGTGTSVDPTTGKTGIHISIWNELKASFSDVDDAAKGEPYVFPLEASGGATPLAWEISGLPDGLSVSEDAGNWEVQGTVDESVEADKEFELVMTLTDSEEPPQKEVLKISMRVVDPLAFETVSLATAHAGLNYEQEILLRGGHGPWVWDVSGLPEGLGFDISGQGESLSLVGAPTKESYATDPYTVAITVSDSSTPPFSYQKIFDLVVTSKLAITTGALGVGVVGKPYSTAVVAMGGIKPYTWSMTGAESVSLSMSPENGDISGTPWVGSVAHVTVTVTDSSTPPTISVAKYALIVAEEIVPTVITFNSFAPAREGELYTSLPLEVSSGESVEWEAVGLPRGLALTLGSADRWLVEGTPEIGSEGEHLVMLSMFNPATEERDAAIYPFYVVSAGVATDTHDVEAELVSPPLLDTAAGTLSCSLNQASFPPLLLLALMLFVAKLFVARWPFSRN